MLTSKNCSSWVFSSDARTCPFASSSDSSSAGEENEHGRHSDSTGDEHAGERSGASSSEESTSSTEAPGKDVGATKSAREVEVEHKLAETTDRMLRIAADFDNTRKRWERERQEVRTYAISEFARDLLPVIDAFDNAMNAIEKSDINLETEEGKRVSSIVEGVKLVSKVFLESLRKHGVERIPSKGEAFNPLFHNAVARTVDASLAQETVLDEFAAGYKIADRVLRTAMVRVATPD